jgi:hypothetical protein
MSCLRINKFYNYNFTLSLILLCLILVLFGCSKSEDEISNWVKKECANKDFACRTKICTSGKYRYCYIEKTHPTSIPVEWRKDCFGIHVGNVCQPCESLYSLNFGGAMKAVPCTTFFQAIERKNKLCNNCIAPRGGPLKEN